jgi:NAD(P)-dependent dehydrogenase (short-subunit alcohol dehydrogenase family)
MDILHGKGAIVIGAGSVVGRAIATALIDAGASVLLCDSNYRKLEVVARTLGPLAIPRLTDTADESQVAAAVRFARATFGSLDIVVNCGGVDVIAHASALALDDPGIRVVGIARDVVDTPLTRRSVSAIAATAVLLASDHMTSSDGEMFALEDVERLSRPSALANP